MKSLLGLLLTALAASASTAQTPVQPLTPVQVERIDGDLVCSVDVVDANAVGLLSQLSRQLERPVDGFELLDGAPRVTLHLRQRPVDQVVTYLLGACGLRGRLTSKAIVVHHDLRDSTPVEELEDAAELAYLRALRNDPKSPDAAYAELAMARIQERRDKLEAARSHYDLIAQEHPDSALAPYALSRSAQLLTELGRPDEAYKELSTLLNLDRAHPYGVSARLALARLSIELGAPQSGVYVLEALDTVSPAADEEDLAERLRLRARCLHHLGESMETLRLVDQADRLVGETLESIELRALALEATGRHGDAVRAWLAIGERGTGSRLDTAYANAARIAYETGDDVGVLFVARQAAAYGVVEPVARWHSLARERLTLPAEALSHESHEAGLEHAETLLRDGLYQQAYDATRHLLVPSIALSEEQRVRTVETFARAANELGELDNGISVLRLSLDTLTDAELRRRIYVIGGELYESRGRFDDAIHAYQGRL